VLFFRDSVCLVAIGVCSSVLAVANAQADDDNIYMIDSAASRIHWRAYKAGAFARFGHNHVISVADPSGIITFRPSLTDSTVEISFAVDELVIDNPDLRALYGEDFASVPSPEDIEGTQGNMLSDVVLDGANFPSVQLTGSGLSGLGADQRIELSIALLGREVSLSVPIDIEVGESVMTASGEFRLTHEDLGMVPFSVMMGALQVAPDLDFTYEIRAVKRD